MLSGIYSDPLYPWTNVTESSGYQSPMTKLNGNSNIPLWLPKIECHDPMLRDKTPDVDATKSTRFILL